jgi:U3 small nucleolar RNA-associated protein 10
MKEVRRCRLFSPSLISYFVRLAAFWKEDKLRIAASSLLPQVPACINLRTATGKVLLQEAYNALVECANDDQLLKSINLDVLMHTRSEDAGVRLLALTCSEALWTTHGGKLLGFAAETATFIAECSEDENENVVRASLKLRDAVENVAGSISGL